MKKIFCAVLFTIFAVSALAANSVNLVKNLSRSGENPAGSLIIAADGKYYGTTQNGGTNEFGSIIRFDAETGELTTVASFGSTTGKFPNGELLDGNDGFLYGTAKNGGSLDFGTIFRVRLSDGALTKLAQFDNVNSGREPLGGLIKVANRYYGVASGGGANDCGTVFKVTPVSGTTNWDLGGFANFEGPTNGKKPWGSLVETAPGILIGTTEFGGSMDKGTVFKMPTFGASAAMIQVVREFQGGTAEGEHPRAGLWKSPADGLFYGTTYSGGATGRGTVFRINASGNAFTIVANMENLKGSRPQAELVEPPVADGFLYGTCSEGGANGVGTVFKVSRDSAGAPINPDNVASFATSDGERPLAGLIFGPDGLAYGTTERGGVSGLGAVFRFTTAGSLRNSASFSARQGSNPRAALTAGRDGSLYGVTFDGGEFGVGSVFSVSASGQFSSVAHFTGPDGKNPLSPVLVTDDGTLYGTTYKGGSAERGTFFRVTVDGTIQSLVKFAAASSPRGANPRGALVRNGQDFFGITEKGGTADRGTIYKITVNPIGSPTPATHTTLFEFSGASGEFPFGGLVDGGDGFYYGTTTKGGASSFGTFFKISPAGVFGKVYDFTSDNPTPASTLVKDSAAAHFYGASDPSLYTVSQGQGPGFGTVFKITAGGVLTTLHSFTGDLTQDGRGPRGLAQISGTLLTGVTYGGGGTLFTIGTTPSAPSNVYRFDDDYPGELRASRPEASPIVTIDGAVYGVTQKSSNGGGTIYQFLLNPSAALTSVTETAVDAAIARGIVNPNNTTVNAFFEYSTASDFAVATTTAPVSLQGETDQPVTADLPHLTPGATYYVRLKAGTQKSRTFVYGPPTATSGAAVGVGASVAQLRGVVNPNGRETSVQIEFGPTDAYGTTRVLENIGNGSDPVIVETGLTNLAAQTTYHYRVVATNAAGTSSGLDATFTTGVNSVPLAPPLLGLSTSRTAEIVVILPENLDPDNQAVTFAIDIQPAFGRAEVINNTSIRFTPNKGFKGVDSFTYAVTDSNMARTVGTVTIRNPFTSLKGNYLTTIATVAGEPKGSVKLTIAANGAFTGVVNYGRAIPVKGVFNATTGERSGTAAISIPRKGKLPLVILVRIDTTDLNGALSGTVDNFDIAPDARLLRTKNTPLAGRYTVWLRAQQEPPFPQGHGWATLTISKSGTSVLLGKLGDGTPISAAPQLRTTDSMLIAVPLFTTQPASGRGSIFGRLNFRNRPGSDADGSLSWKRGPQPKSVYFPDGFGPKDITVLASRFVALKALPGTHQLDLSGGELVEPDNLPVAFEFGIPLASSGVSKATALTTNTPENVILSANLRNGKFVGSFVHPEVGATKPRAFSGVLYQKQNIGVGVFLGTATSGTVKIDLQ